MAEYSDQFNLDASGYFDSVDKIKAMEAEWIANNEKLAKSLTEAGVSLENLSLKTQHILATGEKLTATFVKLDGEIQAVNQTLAVTTKEYDAQNNFLTELMATQEKELSLARQVEESQVVSSPKLVEENGLRERAAATQDALNEKTHEMVAELEIAEQHEAELLSIAQTNLSVQLQMAATDARQADLKARLEQEAEEANAADAKALSILQQQLGVELAIVRERERRRVLELNSQQTQEFKALKDTAAYMQRIANISSDTEKSSKGILISWESFARLLVVQSIHQVIYRIVDAMKAAVSEAEQFEIRISEIRTISQGNQLSFEQWAQSVRNVSDAFGIPILDVTEAAYQTLSNRVAEGAETFKFLNTALQFSNVTMSSAKDSVNLLTAAINSFHLNVDEADHIASVFFNTIRDGRIRADDLANIFGRVGGIAHALGLTVEETAAALSTMTINGIPANEAMTLLNNVLSHLLRPTKDMKDLFKQLGVSTGEAAIATYGFTGLLDKIQQFTKGSSEGIAELDHDIRGLRGGLGLANDNLVRFKKNYEDVRNSEPFDLAKKISLESAGKQFEIQANALKNFFIQDFGRPFIQAALDIGHTTDKLGISTNGLVGDVALLTKVLITGAEAFVIYKTATFAATLGSDLLRASGISLIRVLNEENDAFRTLSFVLAESSILQFVTNPAVIATAAIGGLILALKKFSDDEDEAFRGLSSLEEEAARRAEETTKIFREQQIEQTAKFKDALDERYRALQTYALDANKLLDNLAAEDARQFKAAAEATKDAFKAAADAISANVRQLDDELSKSKSLLEDIKHTIEETTAGINKSKFEHELKLLPEPKQVDILFDDFNKKVAVAGDAVKKLKPNSTVDDVRENRKTAKDAEAQAQDDLNKLVAVQAKAEENLNKLQEERDELVKRQSKQTQIHGDTKETAALIAEEQELADLRSKHKTAEAKALAEEIRLERARNAGERDDEAERETADRIAKIDEEIKKNKDIIAAFKGRSDLQKDFNDLQKKSLDIENEYAKVVERIQKADEARVKAERDRLQALRDIVAQIEHVKIPADIKTRGERDQFVKENFDDPIQKGLNTGALTPDLFATLQKEKLTVVEEINTKIAANNQKLRDATILEDRKALDKRLDNETKAINGARSDHVKAAETIRGIFGTLDPSQKVVTQQGSVSKFLPSALDPRTVRAGEGFIEGNVSGKDLQDLLSHIFEDKSRGHLTEAGEIEARQFIDETSKKLFNAIKLFQKSSEDEKKNQAALNIDKQKLQDAGLVADLQAQATQAVKSNTESIDNLITEMKSLTGATQSLDGYLRHRGVQNLPPANPSPQVTPTPLPGTGTSFTPNTLPTPRIQGTPVAAVDKSTNVGTITLNIHTGQKVDAQFLQEQLQNGIRRGQIKLNADDGGLA